MGSREKAIVFGVGPGLGWALARRFVTESMQVGAVARDEAKLNSLIKSEGSKGVRPYAADVSSSEDVLRVFDRVDHDLGEPDLVVFNAGAFQKDNVLDIDPADFERCWRVGCLGGFLVGQVAARRMAKRGHGTIIFTGATAALRGSAGFANLAVPKFGLRALAQSMARELGPQGVHIGFVIIDGQIESERSQHPIKEGGKDSLLAPDVIAELYLQLHRQPRSAWSHEIHVPSMVGEVLSRECRDVMHSGFRIAADSNGGSHRHATKQRVVVSVKRGKDVVRIQFQIAEQGHGSYRHLAALRWIMVFIFVWFAIQKFSAYAAESIQPLIANSPFMSWLGMFGIRGEARVIGSIELTTAALLALGARFPVSSALGAAMATGTFLLTTSFIFTTPDITQWSATGFPIVSTLVEQFLIKDIALLTVCIVLLVNSIQSVER